VAANLALDARVARMAREGSDILHLGFGEARLPFHQHLADRLAQGASRTSYGPVAGDARARDAAAAYFRRRGVPSEAGQILFGPGSKALLWALLQVVPGDVVLPRPSWLTYRSQAVLSGKRVVWADVPHGLGGLPDPAELSRRLRDARSAGADPRVLVLTLPDNPTGVVAGREETERVCRIAEEEDLLVVSDEIYRDVMAVDPAAQASPAEFCPERVLVTTGPSKSLGLGGWRIGLARFPDGPLGSDLFHRVEAVASEVWSTTAGPQLEAAEYALSEPPEIVSYRARAARLHRTVTEAVYRIVRRTGADAPRPDGAFYVYPDFEAYRDELALHGVVDSPSLEAHLLEHHETAVLGGHHFGDDPRLLRFRASTSLLCGTTEQRRRHAFDSDEPLLIPHVSSALARVEDVFTKLTT
jgi:aspartate aminotransferase